MSWTRGQHTAAYFGTPVSMVPYVWICFLRRRHTAGGNELLFVPPGQLGMREGIPMCYAEHPSLRFCLSYSSIGPSAQVAITACQTARLATLPKWSRHAICIQYR